MIPNWVDASQITPQPQQTSGRAERARRPLRRHALGNVGHAQNLDKLIVATTHLRDLDELSSRSSASAPACRDCERLRRSSGRIGSASSTYQPRERLSESLSAGASTTSASRRVSRASSFRAACTGPLGAGRPVIVAADRRQRDGAAGREVGCGVAFPPDRPDLARRGDPRRPRRPTRPRGDGRGGREYVVRECRSLRRARALPRLIVRGCIAGPRSVKILQVTPYFARRGRTAARRG